MQPIIIMIFSILIYLQIFLARVFWQFINLIQVVACDIVSTMNLSKFIYFPFPSTQSVSLWNLEQFLALFAQPFDWIIIHVFEKQNLYIIRMEIYQESVCYNSKNKKFNFSKTKLLDIRNLEAVPITVNGCPLSRACACGTLWSVGNGGNVSQYVSTKSPLNISQTPQK